MVCWRARVGNGHAVTRAFIKMSSNLLFRYSKSSFVRTLSGRELTVAYLQKSGFTNPIFVAEKTELDMKMPNAKVAQLAFFLCNS